jgi:hypothetical protein
MAISSELNVISRFGRPEERLPENRQCRSPKCPHQLCNSDGKGILGCIVFIVILGTAIFVAARLGPIYYANSGFESDVKAEVSRAGAQSLRDEEIISGILELAGKDKISLTQKDVKVDRFAGQIHVEVNYAVPVGFILFQRDIKFEINASSFVGTR